MSYTFVLSDFVNAGRSTTGGGGASFLCECGVDETTDVSFRSVTFSPFLSSTINLTLSPSDVR